MKHFRQELRHWLALALLFVVGTSVAGASEYTINDGTDDDGRLPVYGIFAGAYQKCEFIVPKALLTGLTGKTINELTFYIQSRSQHAYIGTTTVFVKEIAEDQYTTKTYFGLDGATVVYQGGLDATNRDNMVVTFDDSYEYKGGNLLIGMYVTEKSGGNGSVRFYGEKTDVHRGLAAYSYDDFASTELEFKKEFVDFLPKIKFDCDNLPHSIDYDSHDGKVEMAFTGCEADNTALVGTAITATATAAQGYAIANPTAEDDVTITKNDDGTYSFTMPDHSVYINSTLLRDISYKVDVAEPLRFAVGDDVEFELTDVIDGDNPVELEQDEQYTVTFDKDPTETGRYTATFTGIEENGYTGSFQKEFTVQKKHTVTLAAHYFGTYFYANAIETFDDLDLATVTAVAADGTASLTKLTNTQVAKEYPFLIYNPFDEEKTFELWETVEDVTPDNPTPAAQFTGTADAMAFTAEETATKDYYVLQNGKEFVYVIGAGTKPAHRCWIELPKAAGARILTIAIDQTTGISEVKGAANADGWYDLQGRRMTTMPTQRGLYVIDGKKVVVK